VPLRHHTVQVPATSANLGPGYDAYGLALALYLTVRSVEPSAQADRVQASGEGQGDVPTGDDNLLWRSFVAFCEHHDVPVPDVALQATNRIPLERGLGSSSSAIVAGLALARAVTATPIGDRELVTLASAVEGHPDNVAPALLGGLVACTTDDDGRIVVRRINPTPTLRPIVLVPPFRQATSHARGVLPHHLDVADVTVQASRAGHVLAGLGGLWPVAPGAAGDRLHEPARMQTMGASGAVLAALRDAGLHAWLSGAGPSIAVAGDASEQRAAICREVGDREGFELHHLGVDLAGALACPDDGCALAGTPGCAQCPRERL
jgi:homoserine kinase